MKSLVEFGSLPEEALLIACSSHEERCKAVPLAWRDWRPSTVALFHYDDPNPRREKNHSWLTTEFSRECRVLEIPFSEKDPAGSFWSNAELFRGLAAEATSRAVVLDITVFTKRHLLMTLQWLHDLGSDPLLLYTEPEDYDVSEHIPLSFGLSSVEEIPGFAASPDASRPLQVVLFLGYEGDRVLATYERLQPVDTILFVPDPAFRERWQGKSEIFNKDLIAMVGQERTLGADGIDPEAVASVLRHELGPEEERSQFCRMICPLGTKPQAVGAYLYARRCVDPPALIYTSPLRHNHDFFSHGIRKTWMLEIDPEPSPPSR